MTKFSENISKNTIEGKIGNQSYQFKIDSKLSSIDFVEAIS